MKVRVLQEKSVREKNKENKRKKKCKNKICDKKKKKYIREEFERKRDIIQKKECKKENENKKGVWE